MTYFFRTFVFLLPLVSLLAQKERSNHLRLWYNQPASVTAEDHPMSWKDDMHWLSAMPLGNGSLGAMVFGGVERERVQLNEESMWSGSFDALADNPEASKSLGEIRKLLFEGNYKAATALTNKTQITRGTGSSTGNAANATYGSFQTAGDLWLDFAENKGPYENYCRELDLSEALSRVSFTQNGVRYRRETFISEPDQVMVIKLTADKTSKISFSATMNRPERYQTHVQDGQLVMQGSLKNGKGGDGLKYMARLKVLNTGGTVNFSKSSIEVKKANEVVILVSISTDYKAVYPTYTGRDFLKTTRVNIEKAALKSYKTLLQRHLREYQPYYNRVSFEISPIDTPEIPTDKRVENAKTNPNDLRLVELIFQYGRYLLISSSRPNTLPANLQGLWTNKIQTPWNGDYHTNINVQMNYWPAEVTNLSEIHKPFFSFLKNMVEPGTQTAKVQYNMRGWTAHTIANVWGYTAPGEDPSWGMHPGGGAWMNQHIATHYHYTKDKLFLKEYYPVLKGSVEFYMDWLVEDPKTKKLVSGPAASPENTFITKDGTSSQISMGPSHDQELIWQLFSDFLELSQELNIKDDFVKQVADARSRLLLPKIATDGRLMEWAEAFEEAEPGHRHISHLFAVHPGFGINTIASDDLDIGSTPPKLSALAEAAEKSLDYRLANGGGHTGWSAAWIINQYARLKRPEKAWQSLNTVLSKSLCPNLFGIHPPFQMDGNFGTTSGIAEMLLQSHNGTVWLLPALPKAWAKGSISGLKAEGNITVTMKWENGKLTEAELSSPISQKITLIHQGEKQVLDVVAHKTMRLSF